MKKVVWINGMSCQHCAKRVENALMRFGQVKAVNVNLPNKNAELDLTAEADDSEIRRAVEDLGFDVIRIV